MASSLFIFGGTGCSSTLFTIYSTTPAAAAELKGGNRAVPLTRVPKLISLLNKREVVGQYQYQLLLLS